MRIVDGQIHLWEKGTPSPRHRQEPYSAAQAIGAMDQAGVDRALIHPVLWDPDTDITRMPRFWRQGVTLFTEELRWLKGRDLELVMGEALCNWVGWRLPG